MDYYSQPLNHPYPTLHTASEDRACETIDKWFENGKKCM